MHHALGAFSGCNFCRVTVFLQPMKYHYQSRTIFSLLATTALSVSALSAQITNTNPGTNSYGGSPATSPPLPPPRLLPPGPMATLSMAERAQLKAAHDKAIQQNPALEQQLKAARQAMDDARKAIHDAMIQVDPSVGPILDKIAPPKPNGQGVPPMIPPPPHGSQTNGVMTNSMGMVPPNQEGRGLPPGFASLSPGEQQKLEALHGQVRNDPGVVAARTALQQAATPQDRHAAFDALRKAIHDAMIKADPSIEPVLAKLQPGGGAPPPPNGPPQPPPQ
jgi:hypothetical protein